MKKLMKISMMVCSVLLLSLMANAIPNGSEPTDAAGDGGCSGDNTGTFNYIVCTDEVGNNIETHCYGEGTVCSGLSMGPCAE